MNDEVVIETEETALLQGGAAASLSLLARLGGRRALDRVVELLYQGVLADPLLAPMFERLDMQRIKAHQRRFLAQVFSGEPLPDPGLLRRVHAPVVARHGLGDRHFDAVAGHLAAALARCGVAPALQREVLEIAASTRDDVLGR
jgi:hemoglobin